MLGRWRRGIGEQFAFLIVLLGVAVGFVYLLVEPRDWRIGTAIIGVAVIVGGVLRLLLPTVRAGFLAVRGRAVDTLLYFVIGGLILAVDIRLHT